MSSKVLDEVWIESLEVEYGHAYFDREHVEGTVVLAQLRGLVVRARNRARTDSDLLATLRDGFYPSAPGEPPPSFRAVLVDPLVSSELPTLLALERRFCPLATPKQAADLEYTCPKPWKRGEESR